MDDAPTGIRNATAVDAPLAGGAARAGVERHHPGSRATGDHVPPVAGGLVRPRGPESSAAALRFPEVHPPVRDGSARLSLAGTVLAREVRVERFTALRA